MNDLRASQFGCSLREKSVTGEVRDAAGAEITKGPAGTSKNCRL